MFLLKKTCENTITSIEIIYIFAFYKKEGKMYSFNTFSVGNCCMKGFVNRRKSMAAS